MLGGVCYVASANAFPAVYLRFCGGAPVRRVGSRDGAQGNYQWMDQLDVVQVHVEPGNLIRSPFAS